MPFVKTMTDAQRLLANREITPKGCWNWKGYVKKATAKKNYLPYGYTSTGSRSDGSMRYNVQVHRLSAAIWLGFDITQSNVHVLHRCDNPRCFNPDHLFFGDNLANVADRHAKGRSGSPRGESINTAKLTPAMVLRIRELGKTEIHRAIAKQFNVARSTVSRIIRGQNWRHVE